MQLKYPAASLVPDLLRAGLGLFLTVGIAIQLSSTSAVFWIAASLAALFGVFGVLTGLRASLRIQMEAEGVRAWPPLRTVRFAALRELRLDYYSTRRDREAGWMQLTLRDADGGRLSVDSRLEHFGELVETAAAAASRNGLRMDESTLENLRALDPPDRSIAG